MLDFLVFGLPRCGTTWTANWLTTGQTICIHDALAYAHPVALDELADTMPGVYGISCSASWLFSDWRESHSAPVLLLSRPLAEIRASCRAVGLEELPANVYDMFMSIDGMLLDYRQLFDEGAAREAWQHLLPDIPFDPLRHHLLSLMKIEPHFEAWSRYFNIPWNKEGIYDDAQQQRRTEALDDLRRGLGALRNQ